MGAFPIGFALAITTGESHSCGFNTSGGVFCWGDNDSGQVGDGTTTDRLTRVAVPSFTLNIDPVVELKNQRVTTINILAVCDEGQHLHVNVSLTQGSASGRGIGQGKCTGGLESYPVNVPAQGKNTFVTGSAQAEAEAIIRDHGKIVDEQEWTRQVNIISGS